MGAEFDCQLIEDPELKMTKAEVNKKCQEVFEQAAYNYGHSGYTGTLAEKSGMSVNILDETFDTEQEAEKYICDTLDNDKWGPADVVKVKGQGWLVGGWCSD